MWDQTLWAFRADATYVRAAMDVLESGEPFDMLSVYIGGPDVSGHRFWRYSYAEEFENPPPREQIDNFGSVIDNCYIYVDRTIGEMLRLAPQNTSVLIVSDHGMKTMNADGEFRVGDKPIHTNSAHHLDAPPGVFIAAGPGFRQASSPQPAIRDLSVTSLTTVGGVLDVLPTMLVLKGIPTGKDCAGIPLRAVIDEACLDRAKARFVPTHDTPEWETARQARIRDAIDQNERLEQLRSLGYIR
jgi:arylsulfatase A-like enzyme